MKRLLIAVALLFADQAANAATISLISEGTADRPTLILINGQFDKDAQQNEIGLFSAYAADAMAQKKDALVLLDSKGGVSWTGIRIGQIIRQHGFTTAVPDGATCSSACSLAWLGGRGRFIGQNARVGFHAARVVDGKEVSAPGNAIIGAYLHEIGITDPRAITYITQSIPQAMTWLTINDAIRHKIYYQSFSFSLPQWLWVKAVLDAANSNSRTKLAGVEPPKPPPQVQILKIPVNTVPVPAEIDKWATKAKGLPGFGPTRDHMTSEQIAQSLTIVRKSMRRASTLATLQNLRDQVARLQGEAVTLEGQINDAERVMSSIRTGGERVRAETIRLNDARMRLDGLQISKRQSLAERQADLAKAHQAEADISHNISDLADRERLNPTPRSKELQAGVEKIAAEIERVNARLVETGKLMQQSEGQLSLIDSRMAELQQQEQSFRASLEERHGSISTLLAKMQRIRRAGFKT
jgi:predicted  nucleic acid-binding Zn-ribbon protein